MLLLKASPVAWWVRVGRGPPGHAGPEVDLLADDPSLKASCDLLFHD
jgi:hypothetical protein